MKMICATCRAGPASVLRQSCEPYRFIRGRVSFTAELGSQRRHRGLFREQSWSHMRQSVPRLTWHTWEGSEVAALASERLPGQLLIAAGARRGRAARR